MNSNDSEKAPTLVSESDARIAELCGAFDSAWRQDEPPRIEDFLDRIEQDLQPRLLRSLVAKEWMHRRRLGQSQRIADYRQRFPQFGTVLDQVFGEWLPTSSARHSQRTVESLPPRDDAEVAPILGRFQLERLLGRGGF